MLKKLSYHGQTGDVFVQMQWRGLPQETRRFARVTITGCAVAQHCYDGDVSFLWGKWKI